MKPHSLFRLAFFLFFAGLILFADYVSAADDKRAKKHVRPTLGEEIVLPEAGVKFRLFKHCVRTPIPMYDSSYRSNDTERQNKIVKSVTYWRYIQTAANFTTDDGVMIRVYAPRLQTGEKLEKYMAESKFLEWSEKAGNVLGKDNFNFAGWMNRAAGNEWKKFSMFEPKPGKNITLEMLNSFDPESGDSYAVCASATDAPEHRIVLLFRLPGYSAADEKTAMRVMSNIVSSIVLFPPRKSAAVEAEKPAPGKDKDKDNAAPEPMAQSREEVLKTMKDLKGWGVQETAHYILVSNIRRRKDLTFLREDAEKVYAVLLKLVPPIQENSIPGVIRVFENKSEFQSYTEQDRVYSPCVWLAGKREVVCFFDPEVRRGEDVEKRVRNLHQSLFQQYFANVGCGNAHPWFSSGCTRLFSNLVCRPQDRFSMALDKDEMDKISGKVVASRYADVRRLIALSHDDFYKERKEASPISYALLIFLCKGAPLLKDPELKDAYSAIPYRYLHTLMETHKPDKAKAAAWEGIDMKKFNAEFMDFWSSKARYGKLKSDEFVPLSEMRLPAAERRAASEENKK